MSRHWIESETGTFHVYVCQFTFKFDTTEEIKQAIDFYRQKVRPSSRLPTPEWVSEEARRDPTGHRSAITRLIRSHHFEYQRWYERVPLRLQQEGKRQKVVSALERALREFA